MPHADVLRARPPLRARHRSRASGPARRIPYEVHLDGERCWPPPTAQFPPSVIRTLDGGPLRILFGSCRAAAPHEPPWSLEFDHDERAAASTRSTPTACACSASSRTSGRTCCCFVGDQVYADDSSPRRPGEGRGNVVATWPTTIVTLSLDDVADFEEYTWLYHEAWLPEVERWMLSVVPERHDLRRPRHDRRLEHLGRRGSTTSAGSRGGATTSSAG